jgi:hypothetical protein
MGILTSELKRQETELRIIGVLDFAHNPSVSVYPTPSSEPFRLQPN